MNIESQLWKVISHNDAYAHIIQKASGAMRTVSRGTLPSVETLAQISQFKFDRILRDAFHNAAH